MSITPTHAARNGATILVVEDSLTQAERLRYLLEQAYPRYNVSVARNGQDALDQVRDRPPKLIISDIVMPVMDGYEMCAYLKQSPEYREIPVVLLTSLSDPEDIIRGLNAGTDYYLTKPYEEDFLLAKVASVLRYPTRPEAEGEKGWRVTFAGKQYVVNADLQQMLNLLLSTYENAVEQNRHLLAAQAALKQANESLEGRVRERTRALEDTNQQLSVEVGHRKRAEERLYLQLKRIDALRHIDTAILGSLDLHLTLNVLLDQVMSQLHVDAASVLLLKPYSRKLELAAARGFRERSNREETRQFSSESITRVIRDRVPVLIEDLEQEADGPLPPWVLSSEGFVAYAAVPLIAKGRAEGVLEIFHRAPLNTDREWTDFLNAIAGQAAIAIDSARLFESIERSNNELFEAYDRTLEGWSKALDLRDKETEGHSLRVTEMSERIARKMNVGDEDLVHIRRGALLHDIGKLAIPDAILRKPGPLTADERTIMEAHATYAHELLAPIKFLAPAIDIPYCHHEKWDGSGYPRGLAGDTIPFAARIFALADVWDALRSQRPYRGAWSRNRVLHHIKALSGSHFDPRVVVAFEELYAETGAGIDGLPDIVDADR